MITADDKHADRMMRGEHRLERKLYSDWMTGTKYQILLILTICLFRTVNKSGDYNDQNNICIFTVCNVCVFDVRRKHMKVKNQSLR